MKDGTMTLNENVNESQDENEKKDYDNNDREA
jgi:hypothetical protein